MRGKGRSPSFAVLGSLVVLLAPLARGGDGDAGARADALVARLRGGEPQARDAAAADLTELAAAEDETSGAGGPVHEALRRALRDEDPEVRFRVRRILGDPELRVAREVELLLEPQPTDKVVEERGKLLARPDRRSVVFGLLRIAKKALRPGIDPETKPQNEVWKPWGLRGEGQLHEDLRFHLALDLLAETISDADVPAVAALLREKLGESIDDVIDALAARKGAARAALASLVAETSDVTRENAARALGEIGTAEDAPLLETLLDDRSPRVRRAAISAFLSLPVSALPGKVAALADDDDPFVAIAALHLASTFGERSVSAKARKVVAATTRPLEVRVEAARSLARLRDAASTESALRPLLRPSGEGEESRLEDLTKFAAWAAGASGDEGSLEALQSLAVRGGDSGVFYAIARAGGLDFLEKVVKNGGDEQRRHALRALGSAVGDPERVTKALVSAAEGAFEPRAGGGRDFNDFLAAFRALGDRGDDRSRAAMGKLLDTVLERGGGRGMALDPAVGTLVVVAMDSLSKECAPAFEKIVMNGPHRGGGNPFVRAVAANALSVVDPERARDFLLEQFDRANAPDLKMAIAQSLGRVALTTKRTDEEKKLLLGKAEYAVTHSKQDLDRLIAGEGARRGFRQLDLTGQLNELGCVQAYAGKPDDAILSFRRMRWLKADRKYNYSSYNIACSLSIAGRSEDALRWLRRSIRDGFRDWRHVRADTDFLNVFADPRFQRLVSELRTEQEIEPVEDN